MSVFSSRMYNNNNINNNNYITTCPRANLLHFWGEISMQGSPLSAFYFGTQRKRSHFSLPVLTLIFPCLLSCLVSSIERLSLHGSPNWKIMDLIKWSLNAIDTIFSTRSLGSGEPVCPDGTFAAGYTMDAWERWRIVCLAALSVEDVEDIYLFGTMITGLLLIGLGFAQGYRRIQKTGTAVQSLTRLPVMIEAVGRAVSIETETINRNMDSIMEKLTTSPFAKENVWYLRPEWTERVAVELECGY